MSDASGHNPAKELLEEGASLHDLEEAAHSRTACELYRGATTLHPSAALRAPEDRRRIRRQLTDDLRAALEIAGDDG